MVNFFRSLSIVFIGIAIFFLLRKDFEVLFVAAVFGAVCLFLSIRFEVGARVERGQESEKAEK